MRIEYVYDEETQKLIGEAERLLGELMATLKREYEGDFSLHPSEVGRAIGQDAQVIALRAHITKIKALSIPKIVVVDDE